MVINEDSEAVKFAIVSLQFFEAARVLSAAQREKGRILFRPTLMVAGQGLEMLLKACWHLNALEPPKSGKEGHDIKSLRQPDICEPVRKHLIHNALLAVEEGRESGIYTGIPKNKNVPSLIEKCVLELGSLHASKNYPLRYPTSENINAPRTPFLVNALWKTADDLVRRPNDFELNHFKSFTINNLRIA